MLRVWTLIGSVALSSAGQATSFDCTRATSADERAVCANRVLNDRDVTLSDLYNLDRRMIAMGGRGSLIDQQQAWMVERRRRGANRVCLTRAYDRRIAELRAFIDTRVIPRGPF
jgi:uncharacterized protein